MDASGSAEEATPMELPAPLFAPANRFRNNAAVQHGGFRRPLPAPIALRGRASSRPARRSVG